MSRKLSAPVAIAIIVIALVVIGEAIVYTSNHDDFSSDVRIDSDEIIYEITDKGTHEYDVLVMDNSLPHLEDVAIFFDERYMPVCNGQSLSERMNNLRIECNQLMKSLKVRDVSNACLADADKLKTMMSSDGSGQAVVILYGAIPDTVYNGTENSLIIEWISSGGRLYWGCGAIGDYISTEKEVLKVDNGQCLFLGANCIDDEKLEAKKRIDSNEFSKDLSLINNDTWFAVNTSKLPKDKTWLATGYTDGIRSSIVLINQGKGLIGIFGGNCSNYQRIDISQIIACGIDADTVIIDHCEGKIQGHTKGKAAIGDTAYIYLGGYFTVYGKLHEVRL